MLSSPTQKSKFMQAHMQANKHTPLPYRESPVRRPIRHAPPRTGPQTPQPCVNRQKQAQLKPKGKPACPNTCTHHKVCKSIGRMWRQERHHSLLDLLGGCGTKSQHEYSIYLLLSIHKPRPRCPLADFHCHIDGGHRFASTVHSCRQNCNGYKLKI